MQMKKYLIALLIAAMSAASCGAYAAQQAPHSVYHAYNPAEAIFRQVNTSRAQYGLPSLRRDPLLDAAAAERAVEIAQKFSHTRPDGRHWSTVSPRAYAENIARGHRSADKTMAAWMSSAGHRPNILSERYGSIGIAAVQINGVMHWVQLFGK